MRTQLNALAGRRIQILLASSLVLVLTLSAFSSVPSKPLNWQSSEELNLRSIRDYREDLKAFMKDSKREDDPQTQQIAIYNLCQLHVFLVADPRFPASQQLQGMRVVTANRLEDFAHEFEKQQLRAARKFKSQTAVASATTDTSGSTVGESSDPAQTSAIDDPTYTAAVHSYQATNAFSGGPSQMFNYVDGRFGPPWDHGEELVDLIENTINPASWRSNGGNGTIHYFRPLRVLVVGATWQVQDETLELLRMLRRADGTQLNVGLGN